MCDVIFDEDTHVPVSNTMKHKLQPCQACDATREMKKSKNL